MKILTSFVSWFPSTLEIDLTVETSSASRPFRISPSSLSNALFRTIFNSFQVLLNGKLEFNWNLLSLFGYLACAEFERSFSTLSPCYVYLVRIDLWLRIDQLSEPLRPMKISLSIWLLQIASALQVHCLLSVLIVCRHSNPADISSLWDNQKVWGMTKKAKDTKYCE